MRGSALFFLALGTVASGLVPADGEAQEAAASGGAADVAALLPTLLAEKDRELVMRSGGIWIVVRAGEIGSVDGARISLPKKASLRRWPTAGMKPGPWSPERNYEAGRLGWQYGQQVSVGETTVTQELGEKMQLFPEVALGTPIGTGNWSFELERPLSFEIDEIVPEPLSRPGDGPLPSDPKGAWKTSRLSLGGGFGHFKYGWATDGIVQIAVTARVHRPPKTYASVRLIPLARPGESGLPQELETLFQETVARRFPAPAEGAPAGAGPGLEVEMLLNAFEVAENYHSYNVALTYTLRDAATGELMARGNGFAFLRGEEKFLSKDLVALADAVPLPRSF